jgi:hypothetical protein
MDFGTTNSSVDVAVDMSEDIFVETTVETTGVNVVVLETSVVVVTYVGGVTRQRHAELIIVGPKMVATM